MISASAMAFGTPTIRRRTQKGWRPVASPVIAGPHRECHDGCRPASSTSVADVRDLLIRSSGENSQQRSHTCRIKSPVGRFSTRAVGVVA